MTLSIRWKPLIFFVMLAMLAYGGYYYWDTRIKIIPEELFQKTLEKLSQLESFRYNVELRLNTGGHERNISQIQGERDGAGAFFLTGTIEGTKIEAYHVDNNTYLRTGDAEKWMTIPGNEVFDQELFMIEIDPLAGFRFTRADEFTYLGPVKLEDQKLYILNLQPEIDHPFMVKHWRDFDYTLYVKRNGDLVKAEVTGVLKAKPTDTMTMVVEFWDYNAKIKLEPPVQ
ncbi:MAG: hypothetical protein GX262_12165 [Clostridia bacterium]|jgi:hypothetical protein|nr:hypothetical protein [Clostridia bacterium]